METNASKSPALPGGIHPLRLLPYVAAAAAALLLWLWYTAATNTAVLPFTWPVSRLVGLYFGAPFDFTAQTGFISTALGITIGKECAGVVFFLILSTMLVFTFLGRMAGWRRKLAFAAITLPACYAISVVVNACRIIAAVLLMELPLSALPGFHGALGAIFNFMAMLLAYLLAKKLTDKGGKQ